MYSLVGSFHKAKGIVRLICHKRGIKLSAMCHSAGYKNRGKPWKLCLRYIVSKNIQNVSLENQRIVNNSEAKYLTSLQD